MPRIVFVHVYTRCTILFIRLEICKISELTKINLCWIILGGIINTTNVCMNHIKDYSKHMGFQVFDAICSSRRINYPSHLTCPIKSSVNDTFSWLLDINRWIKHLNRKTFWPFLNEVHLDEQKMLLYMILTFVFIIVFVTNIN